METTIDVTVEVDIERPPDAVWTFLNDIDRIADWIGEFQETRQESHGPIGVGTVVRYTIEPGTRSGTWEIVQWEPPRRLAWDGPPLPWAGGAVRPRGSHDVAAAGDGRTRLVSRYQPELIGSVVLLRPYLRRWLRRQRQADARTLKGLIEAGVGR